MMRHWNSQITSDCWLTIPNPSLLLIFSYLVPYHCPVCRFAHGHTGVFHNNFLWYKLLELIYIINSFSAFPPGIAFRTFTQHFFAEKCTLPLPDNNFENSFSHSLPLHLPLNELMPITYFEGVKRPCHPSGRELVTFMREREMVDD